MVTKRATRSNPGESSKIHSPVTPRSKRNRRKKEMEAVSIEESSVATARQNAAAGNALRTPKQEAALLRALGLKTAPRQPEKGEFYHMEFEDFRRYAACIWSLYTGRRSKPVADCCKPTNFQIQCPCQGCTFSIHSKMETDPNGASRQEVLVSTPHTCSKDDATHGAGCLCTVSFLKSLLREEPLPRNFPTGKDVFPKLVVSLTNKFGVEFTSGNQRRRINALCRSLARQPKANAEFSTIMPPIRVTRVPIILVQRQPNVRNDSVPELPGRVARESSTEDDDDSSDSQSPPRLRVATRKVTAAAQKENAVDPSELSSGKDHKGVRRKSRARRASETLRQTDELVMPKRKRPRVVNAVEPTTDKQKNDTPARQPARKPKREYERLLESFTPEVDELSPRSTRAKVDDASLGTKKKEPVHKAKKPAVSSTVKLKAVRKQQEKDQQLVSSTLGTASKPREASSESKLIGNSRSETRPGRTRMSEVEVNASTTSIQPVQSTPPVTTSARDLRKQQREEMTRLKSDILPPQEIDSPVLVSTLNTSQLLSCADERQRHNTSSGLKRNPVLEHVERELHVSPRITRSSSVSGRDADDPEPTSVHIIAEKQPKAGKTSSVDQPGRYTATSGPKRKQEVVEDVEREVHFSRITRSSSVSERDADAAEPTRVPAEKQPKARKTSSADPLERPKTTSGPKRKQDVVEDVEQEVHVSPRITRSSISGREADDTEPTSVQIPAEKQPEVTKTMGPSRKPKANHVQPAIRLVKRAAGSEMRRHTASPRRTRSEDNGTKTGEEVISDSPPLTRARRSQTGKGVIVSGARSVPKPSLGKKFRGSSRKLKTEHEKLLDNLTPPLTELRSRRSQSYGSLDDKGSMERRVQLRAIPSPMPDGIRRPGQKRLEHEKLVDDLTPRLEDTPRRRRSLLQTERRLQASGIETSAATCPPNGEQRPKEPPNLEKEAVNRKRKPSAEIQTDEPAVKKPRVLDIPPSTSQGRQVPWISSEDGSLAFSVYVQMAHPMILTHEALVTAYSRLVVSGTCEFVEFGYSLSSVKLAIDRKIKQLHLVTTEDSFDKDADAERLQGKRDLLRFARLADAERLEKLRQDEQDDLERLVSGCHNKGKKAMQEKSDLAIMFEQGRSSRSTVLHKHGERNEDPPCTLCEPVQDSRPLGRQGPMPRFRRFDVMELDDPLLDDARAGRGVTGTADGRLKRIRPTKSGRALVSIMRLNEMKRSIAFIEEYNARDKPVSDSTLGNSL